MCFYPPTESHLTLGIWIVGSAATRALVPWRRSCLVRGLAVAASTALVAIALLRTAAVQLEQKFSAVFLSVPRVYSLQVSRVWSGVITNLSEIVRISVKFSQ